MSGRSEARCFLLICRRVALRINLCKYNDPLIPEAHFYLCEDDICCRSCCGLIVVNP
jgi:hypothetical protein